MPTFVSMQEHNGMRPQDIIILLKLSIDKQSNLTLPTLSKTLGISSSEISKSLQRSEYAGFISLNRKISVTTFLEFLKYGLPYVFPVKPGAPTRGIPTGVSHPMLKLYFQNIDEFVWPDSSGNTRGYTINPLYPALPKIITLDEDLYYATALVELFRIGKTREKKFAEEELKKILKP